MSQKPDLSAKERRIKKAVIQYYMRGKTQEEIAKDMDLSRKTIQRYLNSEFASNLKRVYSDKELFDLKSQIESEIRDGKKLARHLLSKAISHKDATPRDYIRAAKLAQEIPSKHIEMLEEIGVLNNSYDKNSDNREMRVNVNKEVVPGRDVNNQEDSNAISSKELKEEIEKNLEKAEQAKSK